MRKMLATIFLMLSTCAYAEFKLESINDLQNALKGDPQGAGIAVGYIKGVEDAVGMMILYEKNESVKFNYIGNSERKWPSVYVMINLLKEDGYKYPTHGDLPLEHMILTALIDNHYLEKEKIIK